MAMTARFRVTRELSKGEAGRLIEPAVDTLSHNVAVRMRRLVPKRSFRLHDTIEKLPTETRGARVRGGVKFGGRSVRGKMVNYHIHVERGTSRAPAQPYARPALLQSRPDDLRVKMSDGTRG